jgi:hypothetical protein
MSFGIFQNLKDLVDLRYSLSAAQDDGTFKVFVIALRIENADLVVLLYQAPSKPVARVVFPLPDLPARSAFTPYGRCFTSLRSVAPITM